MREKQKNSPKFVMYFILGLCTIMLIAMGSLFLAFALPSADDYRQASQATAQFLNQNPAQAPNFIQTDSTCMNDEAHCFWILPEALVGAATQQDARLLATSIVVTIDGIVQQGYQPQLVESALYNSLQQQVSQSELTIPRIYGNLTLESAGLHLIEVRLQDKDARSHYHAWAIQSDGEVLSIPATLAIPPTYSTAVPTGE